MRTCKAAPGTFKLYKNQDVISWWVGEGVGRRIADPGFAAQLDSVDETLARIVSKLTPSERMVKIPKFLKPGTGMLSS
jgi:hypothetical protein